jgi:hypothetical protein
MFYGISKSDLNSAVNAILQENPADPSEATKKRI